MKVALPKLVAAAFVKLPGSWLGLLSVKCSFISTVHHSRLVLVQSAVVLSG